MIADDIRSTVMQRLGGGMPAVDITSELIGVLKDLSGRADFLKNDCAIMTTTGQNVYALPADIKDVLEVVTDCPAVLERITYRRLLELPAAEIVCVSGKPNYYAVRDGNIYLWPVPDSVMEISIDYSMYHPAVFTTILFRDEFAEAIIQGVLSALYAGQLKNKLNLRQRTVGEREELNFQVNEQHSDASLHSALYEKEIGKLLDNIKAAGEMSAVEYRDI